MNELAAYMGEFAAARPTRPSQTGLVKQPIKDLQYILIGILHWRKTAANSDGKFGPTTMKQWQQSAVKRKLNPAFDRASATEAWVHPQTLNTMAGRVVATTPARVETSATPAEAKARRGKLPPPAKPPGEPRKRAAPTPRPKARPKPKAAPPSKTVGLVNTSVLEAQKLLQGLGWRARTVSADGKFGPKTQGAWESSARARKVPGAFVRMSATSVAVAPATLARFRKDALARGKAKGLKPGRMPAPPRTPVAATPKAPPAPGTIVKTVAETQALLHANGIKKTKANSDGLYGPISKGQWATLASARKLPTTFTRVTGKTVRVALSTFSKIQADAQKRGTAPKRPAAPPKIAAPATPPPGAPGIALVNKRVSELQAILHGIGWRRRTVAADGKYGPKTAGAWSKSADTRKLNNSIIRTGSTTAKVALDTYVKMKADAAARSKRRVPKATPSPPSPTRPTAPATTMLTVSTVQKGLNGKGVKPLLDSDGFWGGRTDNALSAWLKAQPGGANSAFNVSRNKRNVTLPKAFAASLQVASTNAPVAPPRVSIPVLTVKKALRTLGTGYQVGPGTTLDPSTSRSLGTFVKNTDQGVNTGFRVSKDGKTVLRIRKNVADELKKLAAGKRPPVVVPTPPPPPPGVPPKDPVLLAAEQVAKASTVPVPVLHVQQAWRSTGKYPQVQTTGVWDMVTKGAFFDGIPVKPQFRPVWEKAFPMVLSPDNRTIRLPVSMASNLQVASEIYRQREKDAAAERQGRADDRERLALQRAESAAALEAKRAQEAQQAAQAAQEPPVMDLSPVPFDVGPEPPPSPGPSMTRVPDGLSPQQLVAGEKTWAGLVQALASIGAMGPHYTRAVEAAVKGPGLSEVGKQAYLNWVQSARRVMARAAQIIQQSPNLQQAIDAAGPEHGLAGFSGVDAAGALFLGELASASTSAVAMLKEEFPVVVKGNQPLAGLGVAPVVAVPVIIRGGQLLAKWGAPAYRALIAALNSRGVMVVGGTVAAGAALNNVIHGETQAYLDYNEELAKLKAEGKLSAADVGKFREKPPAGGMGILVGGAVVLGGLALYLQSR